MRPSGKITSELPSRTALMMARSENGLSGSSAMVRTNLRNGWIHQRCDMPTSMAKTGRFGRIDTASGASRKLTWLSAMMALWPALSIFSKPLTSSRKKARNTIERKSLSQLVGMVKPMATATTRVAAPSSANRTGVPSRSFCSIASTSAPTTMKAALSTLTAAITRARRSVPAQTWMAVNTGTMNKPPAIAKPARSIAM